MFKLGSEFHLDYDIKYGPSLVWDDPVRRQDLDHLHPSFGLCDIGNVLVVVHPSQEAGVNKDVEEVAASGFPDHLAIA